MPPKGKSKGKAKSKGKPTKAKIPPLKEYINKLYDPAVKVKDFCPGKIELVDIEGKGRGYRATVDIPAGTLIQRSAGFVLDPRNKLVNSGEFFESQLSAEETIVVSLLSQFLKSPIECAAIAPLLKQATFKELGPKTIRTVNKELKAEAETMANTYCNFYKSQKYTKEEVTRLALVALLNSHKIQYDENVNESDHWGVFPSAALINHSCWPNTCIYFSKTHNELHTRTFRPIKEGEEITIAYEKIYYQKFERRMMLKHKQDFKCKCEKCIEADEEFNLKDRMLGGYYCPKEGCTNGVLMYKPNNSKQLICNVCNTVVDNDVELVKRLATFFQTVNSMEAQQILDVVTQLQEDCKKVRMHRCNAAMYQLQFYRSRALRLLSSTMQTEVNKLKSALELTENDASKANELRLLLEEKEANLKSLLVDLVETLKEVNFSVSTLYPPNHPENYRSLLELGNACRSIGDDEGHKTYQTKGIEVLVICRGEDMLKKMTGRK